MDIALAKKTNNPCILAQWVSDFRTLGPEALRKKVDTSKIQKNIQPAEETPIDTSAKRVKELEDELLKLRIENAYLKELRRLRLEEEALLRKQRESSTASEESLN